MLSTVEWVWPTRLPHPWDSPGEDTGAGCHFLLQCVKVKSLSHVQLLATPRTAAYQAPPSMGFSRQEYWSGVHNHWTAWEFSTFIFKIRLLIFSCPSNWSNIENKLTNTCHFKNFCLFLLASHELLSSSLS